jgi:hypothetical protein
MSVKIFRTPRADQQLRSRPKSDQKKVIATNTWAGAFVSS